MVTQFSYWKGNQARNSYQICRGTLIALQLCFDICRLDIILAKQSLLLWARQWQKRHFWQLEHRLKFNGVRRFRRFSFGVTPNGEVRRFWLTCSKFSKLWPSFTEITFWEALPKGHKFNHLLRMIISTFFALLQARLDKRPSSFRCNQSSTRVSITLHESVRVR